MDQTFTRSADNFPNCGAEALGFYPVVNTTAWVERLLNWGVTSIQLRLKNLTLKQRYDIYAASIPLAKKQNARLFINDDWAIAIELGAYGVHLGQEDLQIADLKTLAQSGLRLGVSTHTEDQVAHAQTLKPSYIACGPVFPTTSKANTAAVIGLSLLKRFTAMAKSFPIVAIGGITADNLAEVLATGVQGISIINALKTAQNPETCAKNWYRACLSGGPKINEQTS